jgi:hypothetical protein
MDELACPPAAALAAESPYHPPTHLGFDRLHALISARCLEAVDHICALREDPSYFAQTVQEWSEHHYACAGQRWKTTPLCEGYWFREITFMGQDTQRLRACGLLFAYEMDHCS